MTGIRRHEVYALLALAVWFVQAYEEPSKFLLASDAKNGSVSYMLLPASGVFSGSEKMKLLVKGGALVHPQGLAVDQHRKRLIIADPNIQKVVAYPLHVDDAHLRVGKMQTLAKNVEARWVAADGRGNVFFSNEAGNEIMKISSEGGLPQAVYAGGAVSGPGGIVTDNFNLFWTNKVNGESTGVLVSAPVPPKAARGVIASAPKGAKLLSKNMEKAYGVCMALDVIYYTASVSSVYGVKRSGGDAVKIANSLVNPRGCAWDGEDTMYVADRSGGIFYFPAPQADLAETRVNKAVDFDNAFGVAVFVSDCRCAANHRFFIYLLFAAVCTLLQ